MSLGIFIISHDTILALGLRHLLHKHFNLCANIKSHKDLTHLNDKQHAIFITTPQCYIENLDFFTLRRNRTIIVKPTLSKDPMSINSCQCEEDIANQLASIITQTTDTAEAQSNELSQREIDVLRLVAMGYINKEIADKLNISINTILTHRKNISAKLGIKSVSGLGIYAVMNGIISESDLKLLY